MLALLFALGAAQSAFAQSPTLGKEWSRSGFGSDIIHRCRQPSCGGTKSLMRVTKFGTISGAPELGVPSGSNLEAEFRRRPEVRRILGAMLQQLTREGRTKGSRITSSYFANANHAGFNFTVFDAGQNTHTVAQLRISNNKAFMFGGIAETAARARQNLNILLPTVKTE